MRPYSGTRSNVAGKLIAARHAAGLTQQALANEIGVSLNTVSQWETKNRVPRKESLVLLHKGFAKYGVNLDILSACPCCKRAL